MRCWAVLALCALGTVRSALLGEAGRHLFDQSLPEAYSVHELHHSKFREEKRFARRRLPASSEAELTPLYPGYGTHFSYVYIGTPGQRVSVIVDTGSSLTAFPCIGCDQCGGHTDSYWDIKQSSTAQPVMCGAKVCTVSQGYSEGSTWSAIKISDKLYIGGESRDTVPGAASKAVDFTFGCQTTETGLFRTQLADGIMGMGISKDTLPVKLYEQGITTSKVFTMCFKKGGGIMTLGGVDQRIHSKPEVLWAKLTLVGSSGWYGVVLLDVLMVNRKTAEKTSMEHDTNVYANGEGSIVDSGTTDTYLPSAIESIFSKEFKSLTGMSYSNENTQISPAKLAKMPDIIFRIKALDGGQFDVLMPWSSYVDGPLKDGSYAFRIYFQDGDGAVLGANFMANHNIIFDQDGGRVGFAESDCDFDEAKALPPPGAAPTPGAGPSPSSPSSPSSSSSSQPAPTATPTTTTAAAAAAAPAHKVPPDDDAAGRGLLDGSLLFYILAPLLGLSVAAAAWLYYCPRSAQAQGEDMEMVQTVVFDKDNVLNPFTDERDGGGGEDGGVDDSSALDRAGSSHSFLSPRAKLKA